MKIGILTFQRVYNYGAVLQSFALQSKIKELGFNAEIIDYRSTFIEQPYRLINLRRKGIKNYLLGVAGSIIYSFRKRKTRKFQKEMIFTKSLRKEDLNTLNDEFDLFLTGSDQVWNYQLTNSDDSYFLSFVQDNKKKASYAASIGVHQIPDEFKEFYKNNLQGFFAVSVREQIAADLLSNFADQEITVVPDPTLLLTQEDWSKLAKEPKDENFVFVYQLSFSSDLLSLAHDFSRRKGLGIICAPFPMGKYIPAKWDLTAGPAEILGYIKNSDFVFTTSYHGVIMALLFHKPFAVIIPSGIASVGSRIYDLLKELNLEYRIINRNNNTEAIEEHIDFDAIDKILNEKKLIGENYLKRILKLTKS